MLEERCRLEDGGFNLDAIEAFDFGMAQESGYGHPTPESDNKCAPRAWVKNHFAIGLERDLAITAAYRNGCVQAVLQKNNVFEICPFLNG